MSCSPQAGLTHLRAKSVALTGYLAFLLDPLPLEILTPVGVSARGCQLSLRLGADRAAAAGRYSNTCRRAGMVCDWREPDVIRVAPGTAVQRL